MVLDTLLHVQTDEACYSDVKCHLVNLPRRADAWTSFEFSTFASYISQSYIHLYIIPGIYTYLFIIIA
jgi:hypothetical protein